MSYNHQIIHYNFYKKKPAFHQFVLPNKQSPDNFHKPQTSQSLTTFDQHTPTEKFGQWSYS